MLIHPDIEMFLRAFNDPERDALERLLARADKERRTR